VIKSHTIRVFYESAGLYRINATSLAGLAQREAPTMDLKGLRILLQNHWLYQML